MKGSLTAVAAVLCVSFLVWSCAGSPSPTAPAAGTPVHLKVSPANSGAELNRKLFSLVNSQGILQYAGALSVKAYQELGLAGAQQRLATEPGQFEKVNDNADPFVANPEGFAPADLFAGSAFQGTELVNRVLADGEEPSLLLAYNLAWLAKDGKATGVPTSNDEWAEFAVQAIKALNGTDPSVPLKVKMVEIWNEPDIAIYWAGTREEFYQLFNTVADRIKKECPGVKVGGPVAVNVTGPFSLGFIEACGSHMDTFIFHSYGETVATLTGHILKVAASIEKTVGHPVKLVLTESDNINFKGADKADYLMTRQFRFLQDDVGNVLEAFHQFQVRGYNEGDRVFGLIEDDGSVIGYNYWPYWMFRDLHGKRVPVVSASGEFPADLLAVATTSADLQSTVLYLPAAATSALRVTLDVEVPEALRSGVLVVSRLKGGDGSVESARLLTGKPLETLTVSLAPGQGVTVSVRAKAPASLVWSDLTFDRDGALAGESLRATLRVTNLGLKAVGGRFSLQGTPDDWQVTAATEGADQISLAPGESTTIAFDVKTLGTTPPQGSAVYGFASLRPEGERPVRVTSIPKRVRVLSPVSMTPVPLRHLATAGEKGAIEVVVRNTFSSAVSGSLKLTLPEGFTVSAGRELNLPVGAESILTFTWEAGATVKEGEFQPTLQFLYKGIPYLASLDLAVLKYAVNKASTPVDLTADLNADGVTSAPDFADFHGFGGRFTYAGEFMPKAGKLSFVGTDFLFPYTSKGKDNLVETRGQTLALPAGQFKSLDVLCTSTNSNKKEILKVTYADGTSQAIAFAVTDWCVTPKNGEVIVYKAPYRHIPEGVLVDAKPQIFYLSYPLDPAKTVASLVLPDKPDLYLFAVTMVK